MLKPSDMQEAVDGTFCRGYVIGVVDGLIVAGAQAETLYCIPNNADSDQLVRIVKEYLDDKPANLNNPAATLVTQAMIDAFPCK